MAYVYRHIRLDKNEVFYIGIGKDSDSNYRRAYVKEGRNSHWINITNITDYEIEIIIDNLTWEEAAVKEIEFISLYGRYDIGHGTLVNQTDGGTGGSDGGKAKGKVWVYKEGVQTRIKRELLEDHLKEGWTKGLLESTIKKRGTVHKNLLWINKDGCNKRVFNEVLESYLSDNWKLGLSDAYKDKISASVTKTMTPEHRAHLSAIIKDMNKKKHIK